MDTRKLSARVSASITVASDRASARKRSTAACVAGERNDGARSRGTQCHHAC